MGKSLNLRIDNLLKQSQEVLGKASRVNKIINVTEGSITAGTIRADDIGFPKSRAGIVEKTDKIASKLHDIAAYLDEVHDSLEGAGQNDPDEGSKNELF